MSNPEPSSGADLPTDDSVNKYGSIEIGISGTYVFSINDIIKEAWEKTEGTKVTLNVAATLYTLLYMLAIFVIGGVFSMAGLASAENSMTVLVVSSVLQQLLLLFFTLPLSMGLFFIGLKRSVSVHATSSEIFNYFGLVVPMLVTTVIMQLMLAAGFFLLVIPGIYLAVAYYMALPLVIDKKLSPWQALETSRKAVSRRWFSVFGLFLLLAVINVVAAIPLGIGLIWTLPMSVIACGILYRNMFGVEKDTLTR